MPGVRTNAPSPLVSRSSARPSFSTLLVVAGVAALFGFVLGRSGSPPPAPPVLSTEPASGPPDCDGQARPLTLPAFAATPPPYPDTFGYHRPTSSFEETNQEVSELTPLDDFFRTAVQSMEEQVGDAYAGAASKLSAEEVQIALQAVSHWPAGPRRAAAESLLLRRWGQLEPTEALNWAASIPEPLRRHELARQALLGWASNRPEDALAYVETNAVGGFAANRLRDVFEGAMHAETATALRFIQQLDAKRFGNEAGSIIWSVFGRDPAATLMWIQSLPDSEMKQLAADRIIDHWARYDPWAAREWMERAVPPEQRLSAQIELGESWARVDPAGAVNWFLDLPPEEQNGRILDRILHRWMQYDAEACTQWLRDQPPTPLLDRARAERAAVLARRNAEDALALARQIADGRRRASAEEQIVWEWYRRDRLAAVDYALHRSSLPDAARQRIVERARRDAEREANRQ